MRGGSRGQGAGNSCLAGWLPGWLPGCLPGWLPALLGCAPGRAASGQRRRCWPPGSSRCGWQWSTCWQGSGCGGARGMNRKVQLGPTGGALVVQACVALAYVRNTEGTHTRTEAMVRGGPGPVANTSREGTGHCAGSQAAAPHRTAPMRRALHVATLLLAHLMRPLFRCLARPMKDEWKMRPYLGVLPFVLSALQAEACAHVRGQWDD